MSQINRPFSKQQKGGARRFAAVTLSRRVLLHMGSIYHAGLAASAIARSSAARRDRSRLAPRRHKDLTGSTKNYALRCTSRRIPQAVVGMATIESKPSRTGASSGLRLCVGGIPGVLGGVLLVHQLNAKRYENTLLVLVGATVAALAFYSLWRSVRKNGPPMGRDRSRWLPWIAAGIGAEVGFSSAGAGALGSLALLSFTSLSPAQVVGTDMLFGLVVALIGGGFHVSAGHYDSVMMGNLLFGGLTGVIAGANLSTVLPARPLRIALSLALSCLGVQLCWRGIF